MENELPEVDELVVCKVVKINPNSVNVELIEYNNASGMIHVSEVANTWVRDIRKHVKMGQIIITKVKNVDRQNNILNLSLKRVNATQKREKLNQWQNEKKALNFMKFVAEKLKKPEDYVTDKIVKDLKKKYVLLYEAFKIAMIEGKESLINDGIDKEVAQALEEVAKKNIKIKEISIRAKLILKSEKPDGVIGIKKALNINMEHVQIKYISVPEYSIEVSGEGIQYPELERTLNAAFKKIESAFVEYGTCELVRE